VKVACLFGSLNRGGAETLALDILNESKNPEIEFICIHRKRGELYSDFKESNIPLFQMKPRNRFDLFYIIRLRRLLINEKINLVHSNQLIDSFISNIVTLFLPIKTVLTFHGHGLNYKFLQKSLRWVALRRNDLNLFVSQSQLNFYKKRHRFHSHNQFILYNGISFSKFDISQNHDFRKELGIAKNILLSGSVGSFSNGRDQLTICKFLFLLNQQGVEFYHIFIGAKSKTEPQLYDQCVEFCKKNKLSDKISFLGLRHDVPEILAQLDSFIYSTAHDTFGIAVVEAMAAKVPVFVNDWEVMLEITDQGKYATIYITKDEQDLYVKFLDFLSNRDKYSKKAIDASKFVRDKFSIERHLAELTKIYSNILNP